MSFHPLNPWRQSLVKLGACAETLWPYDVDRVLDRPKKAAYTAATKLKLKKSDIKSVDLDLDAWKSALAAGFPIVFGTTLFDSFDQCNEEDMYYVVPMPDPDEVTRAEHGGHCMVAVGYSDVDEVFIVRNSWGTEWGEEGYCYMPYNYIMSPEFGASDAWILQAGKGKKDKEGWVTKKDKGGKKKVRAQGPAAARAAQLGVPSILNGGRGVPFDCNPYPVNAYSGWVNDIIEEAIEYNEELPDEYVEIVEEFGAEDDEDGRYSAFVESIAQSNDFWPLLRCRSGRGGRRFVPDNGLMLRLDH